jgi:excisionase family DNA binding protein
MSQEPVHEVVPPRLLSVPQLATFLGVSPAWVRKQILGRAIPFTKLGRNVRFTPAQVRQILDQGALPVVPRPRYTPQTRRRTRL